MASNKLQNLHSTPIRGSMLKKDEIPSKRYKESEKRLFQTCPDIHKVCARCNKNFTRAQNYLQCKGCKLCFCNRCSELSKSAFDILNSGELEDFRWSCKSFKILL